MARSKVTIVTLLLAIIDKAIIGKADGYGLRMSLSLIFSSQVE